MRPTHTSQGLLPTTVVATTTVRMATPYPAAALQAMLTPSWVVCLALTAETTVTQCAPGNMPV